MAWFRLTVDDGRPNAFGSVLLGPTDQPARSLRTRVQVLLTVLLVGTNVVGAAIVVILSTLVIPGPTANDAMVRSLSIAVPVYVAAALLLGATWGTTGARHSLRWATRGQEPTEQEQIRTLAVPWFLTRVQAYLWLGAALLFTLLAVAFQPGRAVTTGFTVAIAGIVVSAIAYLFSEFSLRPISARALSGEERLHPSRFGVRRRMLVFWGLGTGAPVVGLVVVAILSLTLPDGSLTKLAVVDLALGAVVLTFGFLVTWLNARAVVSPLLAVRDAMERVEDGELDEDVEVQVYDGTELGQLQAGFNQMVRGLREREHVRDMFGRHVGREVADAATSGKVELGGRTCTVSVLFVDLVGSTSLAAEREPAEVVELLNQFFAVVVEEVDAHHGLVNKFIGDAALAIFGAPVELDDHAGEALAAARAMSRRLADEVPDLSAGIGVATGEAVAGNVGEESRFEYTVIGDAVNAAARLTELAKEVDGRLLVAWDSVQSANQEEARRWRRHEPVTLRGRRDETVTAVPATS